MILVIGSINMDTLMTVHKLPCWGETVLAQKAMRSPGGKGANQAVAAAKLGGEVVMLGCVGMDADGDTLLAALSDSNVNTDYIMRSKDKKTGAAVVCVDDAGANIIIVDAGANTEVTPGYLRQHERLFKSAEYCVLQMEIPEETVKKAITLCDLYGVKVILNASPLDRFDLEILHRVDYVIVNECEAELLYGKMPNEIITAEDWYHFMRRNAFRNLLITREDKGAVLYGISGIMNECPTTAREPVDTSGAGDAFLGAFVSALSEGHIPVEAINFANCVAGVSIMKSGAQPSMPTKEEMSELFPDMRES